MNFSVLVGDALVVLRTLPAESVQCCVTSPPYWGLRDYGTATWEGGEVGCDHVYGLTIGTRATLDRACPKCGARRIDAQLGLERTPEEYVGKLVEVFREVRRVLRKDGTLWLVLGDSYAASRSYQVRDNKHVDVGNTMAASIPVGLKSKDLVGVPWRVAFALQADGWWLRSDIIWAKPNPMPESVTDRPTKAHEYVFLLSKSAKYFFDQEAVREANEHPNRTGTNPRLAVDNTGLGAHGSAVRGGIESNPAGRNVRSVWSSPANDRAVCEECCHVFTAEEMSRESPGEWGHPCFAKGVKLGTPCESFRACSRGSSVWTIATQPFPEAHFATFPEALAERCIKAGSREGDTVLDPFCGSGTTGAAAVGLQRSFVGVELNSAYAEMAERRIGGVAPLFLARAVLCT